MYIVFYIISKTIFLLGNRVEHLRHQSRVGKRDRRFSPDCRLHHQCNTDLRVQLPLREGCRVSHSQRKPQDRYRVRRLAGSVIFLFFIQYDIVLKKLNNTLINLNYNTQFPNFLYFRLFKIYIFLFFRFYRIKWIEITTQWLKPYTY